MKLLMLCMILLIFMGFPCFSNTSATKDGGNITLKNELVTVILDGKTGHIISFSPDKANLKGKWFEVVKEERTNMKPWEFWEIGKETVFSGENAQSVEVANSINSSSALFTFKEKGLDILAEVMLESKGLGPKFRITVKNLDESYLVDTINFKISGMKIGDGADNFFLYPKETGIRMKTSAFKPGDTKEDPYPGFLYMQWLDIYNEEAGVYLGSLDDYGYTKKLVIGKNEAGENIMEVSFSGCYIAKSRDQFTTPYVQIASHKGDWRTGADLYRVFAEKAFGPVNPPTKIKDMPAAQCWLAHHASNGDIWKLFEQQQQAPIHASYLTKSLTTSVPEGWDGFLGSALEYQESFDNIKRLGGNAALFTFDRAPLMGRPNYADYAGKWTNVKRGGSFEEAFKDIMPSPFDENFRKARIGEVVRWVRDFGLDELHYDTEGTSSDAPIVLTGLMGGPSYRSDFKQRPNETPHYFKTLYKETLEAARKYNPEFTLRAEHCADFFYPEFEASTAHLYYSTLEPYHFGGSFKYGEDYFIMPEVFRYTLPKHSQLQMPSVSNSDMWMYSYGMGYGFHGGGPSWTFNPKTREPEMPDGQIRERYAFYDKEWRAYYDFRVGFTEAILEANKIDTNASVFIDDKWVPCDYSSDVKAITSMGKNQEVTLGELSDYGKLSEYGQKYISKFNGNSDLRPFKVKFPVTLENPKFRLYTDYSSQEINPQVINGFAEVEISDTRMFAIEAFNGADLTMDLPSKAVSPGEEISIKLNIANTLENTGEITFEMPANWDKIETVSVPENTSFSKEIKIKIPEGIFGRNYPIKVVYTAGDFKRTIASTVKIMDKFTVLYSFDTLDSNGKQKNIYALTPKSKGVLKIFIINNQDSEKEVDVNVKGEFVNIGKKQKLAGINSRLLGDEDSPVYKWVLDGLPEEVPNHVVVFEQIFDFNNVPKSPIEIEVKSGNDSIFKESVFPRTMVMDLNGNWKHFPKPKDESTVGGVEGRNSLDLFLTTPENWDGSWDTIETPFIMDDVERKNHFWSVYRKLVFIPKSWQGSEVFMRLPNMGGPWSQGSSLNLIYFNGWPCGRIGLAGETDVSSFLKYGSWNLIAVASYETKQLIDPYLFVRNVPDPSRVNLVSSEWNSDEVFVMLDDKTVGYGLSLPASKGVPEKDYRRIIFKNGGEALYINVNVADGFMFNIDEDVIVKVEYFDEGNGAFTIQYDSHDPTGIFDGAFTSCGEEIKKTNTNQWKVGEFTLKRAKFANREFGVSDFRIEALEDDLIARKIVLSRVKQ